MEKKQNKKIKKSELSISIILLIGILVVINFFAYQIFYRWDLTQNKIYSISKVSKKTVENLDDVVNIKAYFSNNLPNQLYGLKQEVADILDEYASYSKGKIIVKFIAPKDDDATKRELYTLGIPQLTFEVYEKDKRQLVNGYMGIAISYGDKTEVIPAIKRDTSDLEYQITTAIKKVTSSHIATIGFLTGQGEASLNKDISNAYKELQKLYTVQPISFSKNETVKIPSDIDTLIIAGPTKEFSDNEIKALKDFVKQDKSLLVLSDGVSIGQGLKATSNKTNINKFLSNYGIILNKDLVADVRNGVASFTQGFFTFSSNYPFWPEINQAGFNHNYSAVSSLRDVIFPWASSIDIDKDKLGSAQAINLAFTTDKAWEIKNNFAVDPNSARTPQGTRQQYTLAVAVSGLGASASSTLKTPFSQKGGRIIVVGDSDFARDNFAKGNPDNLTLFLNLVDSLSLDSDLINIRSKVVSSRPIKTDLSEGSKIAIRYFNILGLTIIVILFGLLRYFLRKKNRFVDDL